MNKEIQEFQESFFFGLSMRQCFFSVLAIAAAVGVYLGTKDRFAFFRADACVTKLRLQNLVQIRNGLSYEFPLYFGYE